MDCVSTIQAGLSLRPRRLKGLRRPTREIPGLGTAELVREERCHGWQILKQLVPSRLTIVDQVLLDDESDSDSLLHWETLWKLEPVSRVRLATELCEQFGTLAPDIELDDLLRSIDEWLAPYRISRSGNDYLIHYDCTDAPAGTVMGNVLVNAFIDSSGSLARVDTHGIEMAELMELELREAYRQRVVPIGCGFVADSIADRLICAGYVRPSDEYWTLLGASIKQTEALLNTAEASHQPFLAAALRMLKLVHSDAVNRLKS